MEHTKGSSRCRGRSTTKQIYYALFFAASLCLLTTIFSTTTAAATDSPTMSTFSHPVYRAIQYDKSSTNADGVVSSESFGTPKTGFTWQATTLTAQDLARQVVVAHLADVTPVLRSRVLATVGQASALIIVLPLPNTTLDATVVSAWNTLEHQLLHQEVKIPIYFAYDSPQLHQLYHDIDAAASTNAASSLFSLSDSFSLTVTGETAPKLKDTGYPVIQGWLPGAADPSNTLPTIVFVANYDTSAFVPVTP
eukprot:TRINITY_DN7607_c0_g1_i2.p1 TRINITY_DN7607_c0_g1~~TRINITY_DN7607_c0_g1_i2.p1  ORF type:complete len:262 (+),score=35.04 TRINITY_DN7607_c0_g1_i2:35-787(+)